VPLYDFLPYKALYDIIYRHIYAIDFVNVGITMLHETKNTKNRHIAYPGKHTGLLVHNVAYSRYDAPLFVP
jgi:hypothetical protein